MHQIRQAIKDSRYSVREIAEDATRMDDIIRLDIGQPDMPTPQPAIDQAKRELDSSRIEYTSLWGIDSFREQIASFESHKDRIHGDNVMVTTGGIGALYTAFTTICEPGDNIVVNDPSWAVYPMILTVAGVEMRRVPFFDDEGDIDTERIDSAVDDRTRAIVVNSPENPSGRVYTKEETKAVADVAEDNDVWLIGDEVYDRILFDREHVPVAQVAPERTITINSMSKNFSMTGWRIGWLFTRHEDIIFELGKANRATTACPNFLGQKAAEAALKRSKPYLEQIQSDYRERRKAVVDAMEDLGLEFVSPDGAIYAFPDVKQDSWEFAKTLLEQERVAVVPGTPSGASSSTNIRICFGSASVEDVKEGLSRIQNLL